MTLSENSPLPPGVLPIAQIQGAPALQIPALRRLYDHTCWMSKMHWGVEYSDEYYRKLLAHLNISAEDERLAMATSENLHGQPRVSDAQLAHAVAYFRESIALIVDGCLEHLDAQSILGEPDTSPRPHDYPQVREEEVAMQGVRYGCGCMSVLMMVTVIPAFAEAALSQHIVTRTLDPVMDFEDALAAAAFAIIISVVLSLVYRKLFAKYFEPKVLAVSFVLALALGALAAVGDLADGGKSEQEDINELFEFDGDSK